MRLEVTKISALNSNGTPIDPQSVTEANLDVEYFTTMDVYALELGGAVELPMNFRCGGNVKLGLLTIGLTQERGPESVLGGTESENALSWGDAVFGLNLFFGYEVSKFRGALTWDLFWGAGGFDHQRFMDRFVDGRYMAVTNRVCAEVSYDLGFLRPFVSLGALFYSGSADLRQADTDTPRTYDVSFGANTPVVLGLGATLLAEKYVYARFEATFFSETTLEVTLGASLG